MSDAKIKKLFHQLMDIIENDMKLLESGIALNAGLLYLGEVLAYHFHDKPLEQCSKDLDELLTRFKICAMNDIESFKNYLHIKMS